MTESASTVSPRETETVLTDTVGANATAVLRTLR